jgi:hypothetical protein
MEHPTYSPALVPNDFLLFPKRKKKVCLKGQRFQDTETSKRNVMVNDKVKVVSVLN